MDTPSFVPTVDYITEHIATSAKDITTKNGTITFAPGSRSQIISISSFGDVIDEADETFRIRLLNAKNAFVTTPAAIVTLLDNDAAPSISIYDTTTNESTLKAVARISLSNPSGKTIKVLYDTKNATAVAGSDYTAVSNGSISFAAGEVNKFLTIVVKNDNVQENTETFQVTLKSPSNAIIATSTGTISLYNGSAAPPKLILLEAEAAAISGATIQKLNAGFSGTGYVDYVNASNDYIEWTVNPSLAGTYNLRFRYANAGTTNRPLQLKINGTTIISSLAFAPTGAWSNWNITNANANLLAGTNKIRLTAIGSSGPNMDNLTVANTALRYYCRRSIAKFLFSASVRTRDYVGIYSVSKIV